MTITVGEAPVRQHMTREEFASLPEGPPYYELINGALVLLPSPELPSVLLRTRLMASLESHVHHLGSGWLLPGIDVYLPGTMDVYCPNLTFVSQQRLRLCRRNGVHGVPDLVVEILSPSTESCDRQVKLEACRRAGVAHVWLIDPKAILTVEEYVLAASGWYEWRVAMAPEVWSPALFPGWSLDLGEAQAESTLPEESEPNVENPEATGEA